MALELDADDVGLADGGGVVTTEDDGVVTLVDDNEEEEAEDDHDARGDGDGGDPAVDRNEGASEDLSPEDEVAWTPRSLAPDSPAVVALAEDDSDGADDGAIHVSEPTDRDHHHELEAEDD